MIQCHVLADRLIFHALFIVFRPVASHPGVEGGGSELGWVEHYTGADTGFPGGGGGWGGGEDIHKHHPPPLDIVRVTSSALRKIEKHPHSWTFTSTPPPHHTPWTVPV